MFQREVSKRIRISKDLFDGNREKGEKREENAQNNDEKRETAEHIFPDTDINDLGRGPGPSHGDVLFSSEVNSLADEG
jgi:hypothetical protein